MLYNYLKKKKKMAPPPLGDAICQWQLCFRCTAIKEKNCHNSVQNASVPFTNLVPLKQTEV